MAVRGPVRALLTAHLQATWNRSRQELGKSGRLVQALVAGLSLLFGGLPLVLGSLVCGFLLGQRLDRPVAALVLAVALTGLSLGGGLVGGISGGSRVLAWESTRVFPLGLRQQFMAELVAGLGDLLPLVVAASSGCLLAGVGLARPVLLPLLALPWLGTVGGMLAIQYLVNSLAARVVRHLQVALLLLAILAWALLTLLPALEHPRAASGPLTPDQLHWLGGWLAKAQALARWTPPFQSVAGLRLALGGHWGAALLHQLYPALALAGLLLLAARVLAREADPQVLRPAAGGGRTRLWGFKGPVEGLARLHLRVVLSSHVGKFGFLIPVMVLVLLRGPGALARSGAAWQVPASFAYLALSGIQMQLNQFGLDGGGVKTLLLLPLQARQLLAGKALALGVYLGAQVLLLLVILGLSHGLRPGQVLPAVCLAGCMFFYQVGLGHWTSAWLPRPMPRDSLKNNNMAPAVVWLGMAATTLGAALFGGAWLLTSFLAPAWLLPVMAILLAAMGMLYARVLLPSAAQFLDERRDVLVQMLG